jgi:hypothetical protein
MVPGLGTVQQAQMDTVPDLHPPCFAQAMYTALLSCPAGPGTTGGHISVLNDSNFRAPFRNRVFNECQECPGRLWRKVPIKRSYKSLFPVCLHAGLLSPGHTQEQPGILVPHSLFCRRVSVSGSSRMTTPPAEDQYLTN